MRTISFAIKYGLVGPLLSIAVLFPPSEGYGASREIKITPQNAASFVRIGDRFRGKEVRCRMRNGKARPGTIRKKREETFWRAIETTARTRKKVRELKAACEAKPPPDPVRCTPPEGFIAVQDEASLFALTDPTKNYFLCRDLRLSTAHSPLFPLAQFTGVFDFNNKTISGLRIDASNDLIVGLIRINNGVLKNLKLINADIRGAAIVGGVAGLNNHTIENVIVENSKVSARLMHAGGVAGLSMKPAERSVVVRNVLGGNGAPVESVGLQKR